MGRKRKGGLRHTENQVNISANLGTLRPAKKDQNRNRCIKICMRGHTIAGVQRREMETSGVPFQDDETGRMQLLGRGQGTASNRASSEKMEEIPNGKSG